MTSVMSLQHHIRKQQYYVNITLVDNYILEIDIHFKDQTENVHERVYTEKYNQDQILLHSPNKYP
jgi:hypothetical protein